MVRIWIVQLKVLHLMCMPFFLILESVVEEVEVEPSFGFYCYLRALVKIHAFSVTTV